MMIPLTEAVQSILQHLRNSGKTQQRLAQRANIILKLALGLPVLTTAKDLNITPKTVRKWRHRWLDAAERLNEVQNQLDQPLQPLILEVLSDAPRRGKPAEFTPEEITQIIALSCESPEQSGRPVTQWTQRELADEAEKRGIVKKISHRSVGRFLKRGRKAMSHRQQAPSVAVLAYQ